VAGAIHGAVLPMDDLARDVVANLDNVAAKIAASMPGSVAKEGVDGGRTGH
jgi:hypothetical protein